MAASSLNAYIINIIKKMEDFLNKLFLILKKFSLGFAANSYFVMHIHLHLHIHIHVQNTKTKIRN